MFYNDTDTKKKAVELIKDAIREKDTSSDYAYATGLIEMAFALGVITQKEKTEYQLYLHFKK